MRTKTFREEVYDVKLTALSGTKAEVSKWLGEDESKLKNIKGMLGARKGKGMYIWLPKEATRSILAHETVHLVRRIFEKRGVNLDLTQGDEHFAYYYEYWFNRLEGWFFK